jgi:hypothetical protein
MYDIIEMYEPTVWIYGHTHFNTPEFKIGNTGILTNQLGYVSHSEHLAFDCAKTIIV